ncbi:MAG: hypothetical protein AB7G80_09685 [Dongiaceae bacterium]
MKKSSSPMTLMALNLFTSSATLVCCALPALLVTVGAGTVLIGLVSAVPGLVWLSQYKQTVFAVAGLLLLLSGFSLWRARSAPCPADPLQAHACRKMRRLSTVLYGISVSVYIIGFFFAFIAVKVF